MDERHSACTLSLIGQACAFVVVASLATASAARGQATQGQQPVNVGERWVCRGADTAHPANASMSGSNQALSCREVNATITTSTGQVYVIGNPASSTAPDERITVAGPVLSGEMTVSGLNDRWVEMMENALGTEATSGGTVNVGDRWVCRPADATHPQNAALSGGGSRPLACRPVNVSMTMSTGQLIVIGHVRARPPQPTATGETDMIAPPPSSALTPKQLDDAWTNTVMRVFNIATSAAGGG